VIVVAPEFRVYLVYRAQLVPLYLDQESLFVVRWVVFAAHVLIGFLHQLVQQLLVHCQVLRFAGGFNDVFLINLAFLIFLIHLSVLLL